MFAVHTLIERRNLCRYDPAHYALRHLDDDDVQSCRRSDRSDFESNVTGTDYHHSSTFGKSIAYCIDVRDAPQVMDACEVMTGYIRLFVRDCRLQ